MGSNGVVKKDFAKMACVWVDMERGLYDWGAMSQPKTRDGKFLVVKARATKNGKRVDADEEYWFLNAPLQRPIRKEVGGRSIMVVDAVESLQRILARSIAKDSERRRKR